MSSLILNEMEIFVFDELNISVYLNYDYFHEYCNVLCAYKQICTNYSDGNFKKKRKKLKRIG